MPTNSPPKKFHVMEFAHHDEAAAFVAALSRLLDVPKAGPPPPPPPPSPPSGRQSPVEVWARSAVATEGVRLFLSDKALKVAKEAFSPVPIVRTIKRASLPDDSFLIIQGGVSSAWGVAEASTRLSRQ